MSDVNDRRTPPVNRPASPGRLAMRLMPTLSDRKALLAAASTPRNLAKGDCLFEAGQQTRSLVVLCSGMARAVRTLADGSQQIVSIFVAGDTVNAGELMFPHSRVSAFTLTSATSLSIPLEKLDHLIESRPTIARALWLETAAQAAIQQEWMVWLGRRTAQARLAHFMCEVSYRLQIAGQNDDDGCDLPLTQEELSDVLGLSTVHVNRVLQVLRSSHLIELNQNRLAIRDKTSLYEVAEFDPQYLSVLNCYAQE